MYPRVTHPFATRPESYCYSTDPVRLACLIHAASVRSEPESNSPKKMCRLYFKPAKLTPICSQMVPCGPFNSRTAHNLAFVCFLKPFKKRLAPLFSKLRFCLKDHLQSPLRQAASRRLPEEPQPPLFRWRISRLALASPRANTFSSQFKVFAALHRRSPANHSFMPPFPRLPPRP